MILYQTILSSRLENIMFALLQKKQGKKLMSIQLRKKHEFDI